MMDVSLDIPEINRHIMLPSVSVNNSVTQWIATLRNGDQVAASKLWEFLYYRMRGLAQSVSYTNPRSYDEDDIANSAIAKLFTSLQNGRFTELDGRDSLWKLAAVITLNKAKNLARSENTARRGAGFILVKKEVDELIDLSGPEQDPAVIYMMEEECAKLLGKLQREDVKMVALLKIEGFTNEEIADQLGCTRRSVQRRLNLIREAWSQTLSDD
jgi:RNA polymerase sigma factor (sigma-70 family)